MSNDLYTWEHAYLDRIAEMQLYTKEMIPGMTKFASILPDPISSRKFITNLLRLRTGSVVNTFDPFPCQSVLKGFMYNNFNPLSFFFHHPDHENLIFRMYTLARMEHSCLQDFPESLPNNTGFKIYQTMTELLTQYLQDWQLPNPEYKLKSIAFYYYPSSGGFRFVIEMPLMSEQQATRELYKYEAYLCDLTGFSSRDAVKRFVQLNENVQEVSFRLTRNCPPKYGNAGLYIKYWPEHFKPWLMLMQEFKNCYLEPHLINGEDSLARVTGINFHPY